MIMEIPGVYKNTCVIEIMEMQTKNNIKMLTDHLNFLIRFSRFEADINTNATVFRVVKCQQVFELHVYSI